MKTKGNHPPICPDCGEVTVRAHVQNEEGDWFVCWLCGCEPDPQVVAAQATEDVLLRHAVRAQEARSGTE